MPYQGETEFYDAWQGPLILPKHSTSHSLIFNLSGQAQIITAPTVVTSSKYLTHDTDDAHTSQQLADNEARLAQMLAVKHDTRDDDADDQAELAETAAFTDATTSQDQKARILQDYLSMAASNGDLARVQRLVSGRAARLININKPDSDGTPPLVYASCFGHQPVVLALLNAGAMVDAQDRNQWTLLSWAMTNKHKDIAKLLLDHGASIDIQSSSGRTPRDFVPPDSELSGYLHDAGYSIGTAGAATADFYNSGLAQDRFEEELAENEMKRRMMMESAMNLEVDLGNLGLDEQPDSPIDQEDAPQFVWDRCLHDQMFVFQENDLDRILCTIVTDMTPQRSSSQKPIPANTIFLGARYAHYHANNELLVKWLQAAQNKIYAVVDRHQGDMTMLAFWVSNATLLLYYLKKDYSLSQVTADFQSEVTKQIHQIFIYIVRDAEQRLDRHLDAAMLDHETIPGFEDVHFQNEWNFLRRKPKVEAPEPLEKRIRPQSPKKKARVSPTNIISLLSSTLFVLDLYDVHSVITSQALSQLFYWLGAELFNRITSNKRYLARTKAMQIRMNISTLEDWARNNNRSPEHYENGSMTTTGQSTMDSAKQHLAPVVQLLQWLQCFSSLGEDDETVMTTLQQLPRLSSKQLVHAVKQYRAEVGEKILSKSTLRAIQDKKKQLVSEERGAQGGKITQAPPIPNEDSDAVTLSTDFLLPFNLLTSTDMLVTFGAGFGGVDKERARRYIPSIPPDFFAKLESTSKSGVTASKQQLYENAKLDEDGDEADDHT